MVPTSNKEDGRSLAIEGDTGAASGAKHIRRWGADGAIASRHVGNQRPYSYAYKTTRSEAYRLAETVWKWVTVFQATEGQRAHKTSHRCHPAAADYAAMKVRLATTHLQPSRTLHSEDGSYVRQPDGFQQQQGGWTISSDWRGEGSCFWGQVWGEGTAHERVTQVYSTVSLSSVSALTIWIERVILLQTKIFVSLAPCLLQMCVISCIVEAMRLRLWCVA